MAIRNHQSLNTTELAHKLAQRLPQYTYTATAEAVTATHPDGMQLNIVAMNDGTEYWITEAVPYIFKLVTVVTLIALFAYPIQLRGWPWTTNLALYVLLFATLSYVANFLYSLLHRRQYRHFKPEIRDAVQQLVAPTQDA